MGLVDYEVGLNFVKTSIQRYFTELISDVGRFSQMFILGENYEKTNEGKRVWGAVQEGKTLSQR